ncbi:serine/threonine-protein phosphatase 4 regulatory subunit 1 isoform X2 [Hyalella azteca]|nr:serine/threonine-protein phosphatase 4 regulatory subunit 1 isoform X2 [Hyalella azteca]
MEQVHLLGRVCRRYKQELGHVLPGHLLPLVVEHILNSAHQYRRTGHAALLLLLRDRLLQRQQLVDVCGLVCTLTSPQLDTGQTRSEEDRSDALALMCRMVSLLKKKYSVRYLLPCFLQLCSDSLSSIRRIAASNMGVFAEVAGTALTEQSLLPVFVSLCRDAAWEARRACTDSFHQMATVCLPATRRISLAPVFLDLLSDQSRWVRAAALQALGMFISTFGDADAISKRNAALGISHFQSDDDASSYVASDSSDEEELKDLLDEKDGAELSADETEPRDQSETETRHHKENHIDDCSTTNILSIPVLKRRSCEPLGFLSDSCRPPSSPLPAVNLLDQPFVTPSSLYLPPKELEEPSFNSFNYWRVPLPEVELPILHEEDSTSDLQNSSIIVNNASIDASEDESITSQHTIQEERSASQLERASAPTPFGEVMAAQEDLDSSGDSDDDTIIDLSSLSECLSIDEEKIDLRLKRRPQSQREYRENGPAINYDESVGRRIERHHSGSEVRNSWLLADLSGSAESSSSFFDSSRKVQSQDIIPHGLLENFLQMTEPSRTATDDKDICRYCAYAMPAVALTLGQENWHILRDTYYNLSQHYQWRVRRTLAFSMHEMAAILGGEHAAADIIPIYQDFTSSEPECVRIGILENLSAFVRVLPPAQRKHLLPNLCTFLTLNDRKLKVEFSFQLAQLLQYFSPADVDEYIKGICFKLLAEQLKYNKHEVFELMCALVHRLGDEGNEGCVIDVCEKLVKEFGLDCVWSRRQAFVLVAGRMLATRSMPLEMYCEYLLPQVIKLASDGVPNVRLAVAEVLTRYLVPNEHFLNCCSREYELVRQVYEQLQRDRDRDVRDFAASPFSAADLNIDLSRTSSSPGLVCGSPDRDRLSEIPDEMPSNNPDIESAQTVSFTIADNEEY